MIPNPSTNNNSYCFVSETLSLAENVVKFGCWECDLETGDYQGAGIAQELLKVTGKPKPHIEDILRFVHPEDREKLELLHKQLYEGKGNTAEFRTLIDGKIRYIQTAAEIIFDEQGHPLRAVGFIQDISDKKLEAKARKASEQQYRTLFHDACYAIWVMKPDGSFLECNQKTVGTYKADNAETLLGHTFASLAPAEQAEGILSQQQFNDQIQKALKTGHAEFEWQAKDLEGQIFWTHISLNKLSIQAQDHLQVILRDINQEKKSKLELAESEKKYKCFFENTFYGVAIITTDAVYVDCNVQNLKLLGLNHKEALLGKTPIDFSPEYQSDHLPTKEKAIQVIAKTLKEGRYDFDWIHKKNDGTEFWTHVCLDKISSKGQILIQALVQDIDEAKRAKQLLKENEEKYRNIFENSFFTICIYTPDGHLIDCNSRMPELFHVDSKERFFNTTPMDISPAYQPDGRPTAEKAKELIDTALREGLSDFDWYLKRFDGTIFWSHVCLTKVSIGDKDFLQVIIQDIDEAKHAQQQLKENEIRQKFIIKNTGLNMWIYDVRTELFAFTDDSTPPALPDFGGKPFTLDEFMARCHPDDHAITLGVWGGLLSGEIPTTEVEFRLQTPEGNWLWVQSNALALDKDQNGRPLTVLGCNQDIDKKKRAKEMLEESEIRKEFIIKNAGLNMWIWDLKTGQIMLGSENCPLADHFPKEGLDIHDMIKNVHPDDQDAFIDRVNGMLHETIEHPELEYRYKSPDGGWTWIKSDGMITDRHKDGTPKTAVGFHQNITERKRYEQELLNAKQVTEEANRAKSLFLANMSHEIRTPMTAILGYLDLICDSGLTSGERDEYVEIMQRNGMHLLDLINDILDLSKIESGQVDLNPKYVKLMHVIDAVAGPLESLASEKRITIQIDYLSKIPEKIWTDPRLLRQILWNLVGNAVKFTDQGQVRIEIEYCVSSKQEPTTEEKKRQLLKIRVQDTGCGIPPKRLASIFEPFVQADPTATRKFGGTGLGLAIARRQVGMLHGTIHAWNNLKAGATFEVVLPLEHAETMPLVQPENLLPLKASKGEEKTPLPRNLAGTNLLLAEDGLDNQRLISTVLQKAGATVDIANNGQEVIEMVQAIAPKEYDAILMDMQMPILDGYAATSRLRDMKVETPIIALTAHAMADDRKKCLDSGCDGYCTKPIRPEQLIRMISRYVGSKLS